MIYVISTNNTGIIEKHITTGNATQRKIQKISREVGNSEKYIRGSGYFNKKLPIW
jgi:hypothetical protein